jgi:hypothetical protein
MKDYLDNTVRSGGASSGPLIDFGSQRENIPASRIA